MKDAPYKNREIDGKLGELKKQIRDGFDGVHKRQDITNGRIDKNAQNIDGLMRWKSFIGGAVAVLTTLILPILFILLRNIL